MGIYSPERTKAFHSIFIMYYNKLTQNFNGSAEQIEALQQGLHDAIASARGEFFLKDLEELIAQINRPDIQEALHAAGKDIANEEYKYRLSKTTNDEDLHPSEWGALQSIANMTPLTRATFQSSEVVRLVLDLQGINVNKKLGDGTPLFTWLAGNRPEKADKRPREMVDVFLGAKDINVDATDNRGNTALLRAAKHGTSRFMDALLLDGRADVNATNRRNQTALMRAGNDLEKVERLLQVPSIDINAFDIEGYTVLMQRAKDGHKDVVDALLNHPDIDPTLLQQRVDCPLRGYDYFFSPKAAAQLATPEVQPLFEAKGLCPVVSEPGEDLQM